MKKFYALCLLASCFVVNSCELADVKPEDPKFERISDVSQALPYQTVAFGGNRYPGGAEDYRMYFGSTEVSVSKLSGDSIYAFVPLEVQPGRQEVKLEYMGKAHGLGTVEVLDWETAAPHGVAYFETGDPEHPYHITDKDNNGIIPHYTAGKLDKLYIHSHRGDNYVIYLNEDGFPASYHTGKETVLFGGYNLEKGTVNIARFPNDNIDAATYQYGIALGPTDLAVLLNARNGRFANGRYAGAATEVGTALSLIGTVFNMTGCIVGVGLAVGAPPLTLLAGAGLAVTCASAVYDVVKLINPEQDNILGSHLQSYYGVKMSLIDCLSLASKPKNAKDLYDGMYGCYSLALEAAKGADYVYSELTKTRAKDFQRMDAILASGYGDIKITLDWNTDADIDLWVIDPYGEKIYYGNPKSIVSQGELDLDDTDGGGPENVFWPTNQAPFGTYRVQVHYFGPSTGGRTSYRVIINNFGKSKTFTGALSYEQVATVAIFNANQPWGGAGGRVAAPVIELVDRNGLPRKLYPTKP